jgi:hypothetical protein
MIFLDWTIRKPCFYHVNFADRTKDPGKNFQSRYHAISDHGVDANKSIPFPEGGERGIEDVMLTR